MHVPSGWYRMAQKAKDIDTLKGADPVLQKRSIPTSQRGRILEQHVSSVFGLSGAPVVRLVKGASDLFMQRVSLGQQRIESLGPVGSPLLRQQCLRPGRVFHTRKTIVSLDIPDTCPFHLSRQPFPSIETNVHRERKPSLHPHVHQTKVRMLVIMVKVQAFARFQNQMNLFALAITPHRIGQARFDCAKYGDQTLGNSILTGQFASQFLFIGISAAQILYRSVGLGGGLVSCRFNSLGNPLGETLEVLDQDLAGGEIGFHRIRLKQQPLSGAKSQPIKTTKNPCNMLAKLGKKRLRSAVLCRRSVCFHQLPSYRNERRSSNSLH